jgi:hypothetical protein
MGDATCVDLHVDPCCPFAWIAYRWLSAVQRRRPVRLRLHLMSLVALNQGRDLRPDYRSLLERTVGPGRVAAAVRAEHGHAALVGLYEAMGARIFVTGRDHYPVIHAELPRVVDEALAESGLPAQLRSAATNPRYDRLLKASHDAGMAAVGDGVGTPIVRLAGAAFFGPVLSAVPAGADATRLFDALLLLAGQRHLFEIKRPVTGRLTYDAPPEAPDGP